MKLLIRHYTDARQELCQEATFPYNRGVQVEINERKGDRMVNAITV